MVPLAKLPARPHQPHFDCTFGDPEEARKVADTSFVDIAEVYHRLIFQAQLVECFFQDYQVNFLFEKPLEANLLLSDSLGFFFQYENNLALADAREVPAMIVGNGEKPGGEFGARFERAHFVDQFDKDIMHNVFGAGGVPGECDASFINFCGIALVKLPKVTIVP